MDKITVAEIKEELNFFPFEGRNFMTQDIESYYKLKNNFYIELSSGKGIFSPMLFGVTVYKKGINQDILDELNKCFQTREEAEKYIIKLEKKRGK
jgi:hypothetical protein